MKPLLLFFSGFLFLSFSAQTARSTFMNDNDVFGTRVFVENKGQSDHSIASGEKVLYAYEHNDEHIYFTPKGLVYKLLKVPPLTEEQLERIEHGKKVKRNIKTRYVYLGWQNANADMYLEAAEKQSWYVSHGAPGLRAQAYKKIIYKNVYPHTDIEYIIPPGKEHGIKYNIILHPGADVRNIRMAYSGDVKAVLKEGDRVIVKTALNDLVEHEPAAFYQEGGAVSCSYSVQGQGFGFELDGNYDNKKTLIIDPWLTTLTTLTNNNLGYDVDFDYAGNLYVYGGGSPNTISSCKIAKYTPAGVLLWTFAATLPGIGWNNVGLAGIPGNFTVNKLTQQVYTGETFGAQVIRLDANGNYDNLLTASSIFWDEFWEMAFDPCSSTVYAFGGGTSFNRHAAIVDEVNATAVPVNLSGLPMTNQDIVCATIDENSTLFLCLTIPLQTPINTVNHLLRVNPAFTGNTWLQLSGYSTLLEYSNKPAFSGVAPALTSPSSNGFNCLAVNNNFLFYYDGFNLAAYNKATGIQVASTTIPGYLALYQGGIAVDDCNNIYVGGNGIIHVFQFNNGNFSVLPSIPLGTAQPQRVFDIRLDKTASLLYVCGRQFAGTYAATQSCINSNPSSATVTCGFSNNATAVMSLTTAALNPVISYTWVNSAGIVSQTPNSALTSNTVSNLANGTYTVIAQVNAPCGPVYTQTLNVNCPLCSVSGGGTVNCIPAGKAFLLSAGNLINFSSPPAYSWAGPGGFSSTLANPSFTNGSYGVYTLTASNATCVASVLVTLNAPPPLNLVIQASSLSGCTGQNIALSGIASGGNGPYTYAWTGGPASSGYTVAENMAGNYSYTLTSSDADNCTVKNSIGLVFNPSPAITVSSATVCEGMMAVLQASGAVSYTWLPFNATGNPYYVTPSVSRDYTVAGSSNGCTAYALARAEVLPAPKLNLGGIPQNGCAPLCLSFSVNSAAQVSAYNWLVNNISISTNSTASYCFNTPGNYVLALQAVDDKGCRSLEPSQVINIYPKPTADFIYTGDFQLPNPEVMYVDHSYANIASWYWYFGDGKQAHTQNPKHAFDKAAVYTTFLVVQDIHGCADTVSKQITIEEMPVLFVPNSFTPNGDDRNDTFFAKGVDILQFRLQVFTRWGQKIFEADDITKAWDGTFKGELVKQDVYVWMIDYTLAKQKSQSITGHVSVIR